MSQHIFKIGTRGSLLALTQCTLIKNLIEEKTGAKFELEVIKTQGDQITDRPLWQLEGKDFFTKELDESLLAGKIDLVVHSYKDLGSERPDDIELAVISKRSFAHDILLIKKETIAKLNEKEEIVVGTSSPRRIVNIESSLADFLPTKERKKVRCVTLRGNVNTRVQKLLDGNYDAIVLAFAGLERLAHKEDSKEILKELVQDLNFMVLPQKVFPSSASQGALAIEINKNRNDNLKEILRSVHCEETAAVVSRERKAFLSYGGGCHLAVGINVLKHKDFFVHIHKGQVDGKDVSYRHLEGANREKLSPKLKIYNVMGANDLLVSKDSISSQVEGKHNLFVTSKYCFENMQRIEASSLWAGGIQTMKEMAKLGFWVNGTSDSLGHEEIEDFKKSELLKVMIKNDSWKTLSHNEAESPVGEIVACYERKTKDLTEVQKENLLKYDVFFWNSFFQYQEYVKAIPELKNKLHACGLGKTFDKFKASEIEVHPFIDIKEFEEFFKE